MDRAAPVGITEIVRIAPTARQRRPARRPSVIKVTVQDIGIAILTPMGRFDTGPEGLAQQRRQLFGTISIAAHHLLHQF